MPRIIALALLLAACDAQEAPPALLPLGEILDAVPAEGTSPADALAARGSGLRARADSLRAGTP